MSSGRDFPGARRGWLLAAALVALLWFGGLELRGLFDPDEGRYAEIPREMLASGDWVTPRLNGLKYFEKPPLQYWASALGMAAFGEDEWTARLWPAVSGFLAVLFLVFAGNRTGPPGSGYAGGLVLASCLGFFISSQYLTLDMGLASLMAIALGAFLLAMGEPPDAARARRWMLLAWAAMAGAVLTKGLVGIVLPGAALAAYATGYRAWPLLRRMEWLRGGAVFALIALPWHVLAQWRNPEFLRIYILQEHFARYLSPEHHRPGVWWYFILILGLSLIPWVILLPGALRRLPPVSADKAQLDVDRFLIVWAAVIVAFFSLSASKLPAYVIPAMPALALLIGRDVARRGGFATAGPALLLALCGALALSFGLVAMGRASSIGDLLARYVPYFEAGAGMLVVGGLLAWRLGRVTRTGSAVALSLAAIAGAQGMILGLHQLDERYSTEHLVERLIGEKAGFDPAPPFYSVGYFDDSLAFYLGRTMTLVAYRGELGPGIDAEPDKYVATLEEFERRWRAAPEAYAAMRPGEYEALRAQGLPMRLLALDTRHALVSRGTQDPPVVSRARRDAPWMARNAR
ncbi:MAG TPA: glycosyltransferase family 39 protein [Burkholderiales bacterium]|nr:glycosyltransferase family 39 protein [Burkholderiales bacterium]